MARQPTEQRQHLIERYPHVWEHFSGMREGIKDAGPLDTKTQELITTAIYATAGAEAGMKTHATRAMQAGASVEELNQALLLCLGVSMGFAHTYTAIDWVRQVAEAQGK